LLLELWENGEGGDGGTVALGYSTRSRLVDELGGVQPWALTATARLRPLLVCGVVTALLVDPPRATVWRRWSQHDLDVLVEVNDGLAASRS
jgi:hypothetical protein